jgi:hypothetical protein
MGSLTDFERGFLAGLIVGEAHFGVGKGNVQFVIGMHIRHAALLRRVQDLLPGSILYGPYHHQGRYFLRLMLRGDALRSCLDIFDSLELDRWCPDVAGRYEALRRAAMTMRTRPARRRVS